MTSAHASNSSLLSTEGNRRLEYHEWRANLKTLLDLSPDLRKRKRSDSPSDASSDDEKKSTGERNLKDYPEPLRRWLSVILENFGDSVKLSKDSFQWSSETILMTPEYWPMMISTHPRKESAVDDDGTHGTLTLNVQHAVRAHLAVPEEEIATLLSHFKLIAWGCQQLPASPDRDTIIHSYRTFGWNIRHASRICRTGVERKLDTVGRSAEANYFRRVDDSLFAQGPAFCRSTLKTAMSKVYSTTARDPKLDGRAAPAKAKTPATRCRRCQIAIPAAATRDRRDRLAWFAEHNKTCK